MWARLGHCNRKLVVANVAQRAQQFIAQWAVSFARWCGCRSGGGRRSRGGCCACPSVATLIAQNRAMSLNVRAHPKRGTAKIFVNSGTVAVVGAHTLLFCFLAVVGISGFGYSSRLGVFWASFGHGLAVRGPHTREPPVCRDQFPSNTSGCVQVAFPVVNSLDRLVRKPATVCVGQAQCSTLAKPDYFWGRDEGCHFVPAAALGVRKLVVKLLHRTTWTHEVCFQTVTHCFGSSGRNS